MRSNTGKAMSKEKGEPTGEANNRTIAKNIKYSVSRLTTVVTGHRHRPTYQTNSAIGTNDRANDESIVAVSKVIATYTFNKATIPQLWRLIISLIWALEPVPEPSPGLS